MSVRRQAARKLLLGMLVVVGLSTVAIVYLNQSSTTRLVLVRQEVAQLFDASTADGRVASAERCIELAQPLLSEDDPVGATASLYMLALSRLVDSRLSPEIPSEDRVETIDTPDLLNASRLFFNTRRFGPADQLAGLALTRNDEFRTEALRLAVTIRFDIGRDRDTLAHCKELLSLYPNDVPALRVIALVHRNHGRWEDFIAAAEQVLEYGDRDDHEFRINLAEAYVRLGRTSDARREFDAVVMARPDIGRQAPTLHARLLIQEGKDEQADLILKSFLERAPSDDEALLLRGTLLAAAEKFSEAIAVLERAVELAPTEELAYYQLGQAYARTGDAERAKKMLAKHRELLDTKVSLHEMEELASQEPLNVSVRVELAHTYAELGLMDLADFWTRAALAAEGK